MRKKKQKGTPDELEDMTDVTYTGSPSSGEALVWDGSKWTNGTVSTVGSIDDLNDVDTTGKAEGDSLRYDSGSSEWVAKPIVIEVTQAEYDQLVLDGDLQPLTTYVITDAPNLNATSEDLSYDGGATSTHDAIGFTDYASGVWTWRKWENGKLEIWGYDNSQMTVGATAWGSVYSIDFASLGDYPVAFLTLHSVIGAVYINGANGLGTLTGGTSYGLTKAPAYIFIRGTALGSDTRYVTRNIYAVGTWK